MPSSPSKIVHPVPVPHSYSEQINLNKVMQQALQQLPHGSKKADVVVRCENLPQTEADKKGIVRVFDGVMQMMAGPSSKGTKLFLYVACEEEDGEKDNFEPMQYKRYKINFHVNIATDEEWKKLHQKTIADCKAILAPYGAGFTVNEIQSTGCLVSISLLGKM